MKLLIFGSLFISIALFQYSCQQKNEITIRGENIDTSIKVVYYCDAYNWRFPIDSAFVVNGNFTIKSNVQPGNILGSIYYRDAQQKLTAFEFVNRVLNPDSISFLLNAFYIDTSHVKIRGNSPQNKYYEISAGRENLAFFQTQMLEFGYLEGDSLSRMKQLEEQKAIVSKFPTSKYLLSKLSQNKMALKPNELSSLLNVFSSTTKSRPEWLELKRFCETTNDRLFSNLSLPDSKGSVHLIFDTSSAVNMIVVWASWCGPCIKEIPIIEQTRNRYKQQELNITNVSIDNEKSKWTNALSSHKMRGIQLIDLENKFQSEFQVKSIPDIIILDSKGHQINRLIGFSENRMKSLVKIIDQSLKQNKGL